LTSSDEVRHQVWDSLVSMIQVYARAASLNGNEYAVTSSSTTAVVKCRDHELELSFSADSGAASWQLTQQDHGTFHIDDNGILMFPEGPKELDTAAIDWIDQLGQLGQPKPPSVPEGRLKVAQDASPR
jgi:hypothetical protein